MLGLLPGCHWLLPIRQQCERASASPAAASARHEKFLTVVADIATCNSACVRIDKGTWAAATHRFSHHQGQWGWAEALMMRSRSDWFPSHRHALLSGFQCVGRPSHCWVRLPHQFRPITSNATINEGFAFHAGSFIRFLVSATVVFCRPPSDLAADSGHRASPAPLVAATAAGYRRYDRWLRFMRLVPRLTTAVSTPLRLWLRARTLPGAQRR